MRIGHKVKEERLRWFGHMLRRDNGPRMLGMEQQDGESRRSL